MARAAPVYEIDPVDFHADPYPDLKKMRAECPVAFVPQLRATLITRRNDIFAEEKKTAIYSSVQPAGLMTRLMGQNLMRKDGTEHSTERKAIFPTVSPRTVADHWKAKFQMATVQVIDGLQDRDHCDLVTDYAMPVSAHALRHITGLTNMDWREMDRVSQGMIDGCANYLGDPDVEAHCHDCTASIDSHIDNVLTRIEQADPFSLIAVQKSAGLSEAQIRANVKLAISGGQNEPRDAIAGTVWALLSHPDQFELIRNGQKTWHDAFEEFARWISPIGMSPRRITQDYELHGHSLAKDSMAFLMFGSGNRDASVFSRPDSFDMTQENGPALTFGAGPHFCAGAWVSRTLIADIALPALFDAFPTIKLTEPVTFAGWAFRGPRAVRVSLQ